MIKNKQQFCGNTPAKGSFELEMLVFEVSGKKENTGRKIELS